MSGIDLIVKSDLFIYNYCSPDLSKKHIRVTLWISARIIGQTVNAFWNSYGSGNLFDKTFDDADVANTVKNLNFFFCLAWMIFSTTGAGVFWSVPHVWRCDSILTEENWKMLYNLQRACMVTATKRENGKEKMIEMEKENA